MDMCNTTRNEKIGENRPSDLENLTQIIPEYMVSVKLETSENSNISEADSSCSSGASNLFKMQNNSNVGLRPPKYPGFNKSMMPEFSAWVHSNQTNGEGQHIASPYSSHEPNSKLTGPNLKLSNPGIGGLVNGDICEASTFLNYVLNQQRSNGLFMCDPRSNMEAASNLNYSTTNCQNCAAKVRSADGSADTTTYRDASTNTPIKYCINHDLERQQYESKIECVKSKAKAENTSKNFYNQLDLQPHKHLKYESPCKNCGRPNINPNTTICGNCHEPQVAKPNTSCKCSQDCNSDCVKNNRRLHFVDVDRPYTCEICLKNYPDETTLVNHLRYHKGNRPYQCETCNKAFATNSHLTTHKRTHSGEKPFECPECFKTFSDRSSYMKHSRTHGPNGTTIKKFKCPVCSNMFVDSCGLKKHIRIHTGERPYVCTVCNKAFATSSTFVAHKRIHSGERPYSCTTCSKRFITKSHLLTHGRVHSGEKPFCCQVCNRAFADGSSYRRHERLHTGENRFTCDVCGKGFPYETSLAKHKQSHVPGTSSYVYMSA